MIDKFNGFKAPSVKLEDEDIPRIGHKIGVGEDVVHAVMDVETGGSGADSKGRMKMLYEPHVAYRCAPTKIIREKLVSAGLAYPGWKKGYPKDSYPRLTKAMSIDVETALRACSWGLPQILGENFALAGYTSAEEMVVDFGKDEDNQIEAMINFIKNANLDDELRVIEAKLKKGLKITPDDARPFVRGYNGPGYEKNNYHTLFAKAANKWAGIKDTPWSPSGSPVEAFPAIVRPGAGDAVGDRTVTDDMNISVTQAPDLYDTKYHVEIFAVQSRLNTLGYPETGEADGHWGTKTRAAILAFRADNGLQTIPVIDDELMAALMVAKPRYVNPERANATADTLREKGAKDVKVAQNTSLWGKIAAGLGVTGGVAEGLDKAKGYGGTVREIASFLDPVKEFIQNYFWIILVAGGFFVVWQATKLLKIRVAKHRSGEDVST